MVNFDKFSSENTVIFDDFSPKITVVRPKYVPQWFYSRGGSIDADTVVNLNIALELNFLMYWIYRGIYRPTTSYFPPQP